MEFNLGDIIKSGREIVESIKDPHDIEDLTKESMLNVFNQISNDTKYTPMQKLMFFSKYRDLKREKRLVDILEGAIPFLEKGAKYDAVDEDWIADFFDKASKISSDEFKTIWSRILAEEINNPNTISKRLLHNLFLMNKEDAENFINLSRFCFYDRYSDEVYPIIFFREHPSAYEKSRITFAILKALERFSLIECDFESGFVFKKDTEKVKKYFIYTNHRIEVRAEKIKYGNVQLTSDGRKLFDIIEKHNNNLILDYTVDIWKKYDYEVNVCQK